MNTDAFIDITADNCPMTFVRVKLKLEEMSSGQTLTVRLNGGEPIKNVPISLQDENYTVSKPRADGNCFLLTVKKP
ncbi:MAG: sulfurtransferase TusA family protein [Magnetococcales bacterium]|nr:sulfurtransferase TusA family protein [Magnetococcales bacterium]